MNDTTIVRNGKVNPVDIEGKKQIVFIMSDGNSKCAFVSRSEFIGNVMGIIDESLETLEVIGDEWIISTALMSQKEISEMEEFTGF